LENDKLATIENKKRFMVNFKDFATASLVFVYVKCATLLELPLLRRVLSRLLIRPPRKKISFQAISISAIYRFAY